MLNIHYLGDLIEDIDLFLRYFCTTVYFNRMNVNIMFYMSFANSVPFDKNIDLTIDSIGQCLHRITESVIYITRVIQNHATICTVSSCIMQVLYIYCTVYVSGVRLIFAHKSRPSPTVFFIHVVGIFATFFPCGGGGVFFSIFCMWWALWGAFLDLPPSPTKISAATHGQTCYVL